MSRDGALRVAGELHHRLCNVLRVRPGETFILRDVAGEALVVSVAAVSRREVVLAVHGRAPLPPPPPLRIVVAQAIGKGDRFEQVLQHGTELGVAAFIPLITRRTVRRTLAQDGRDRLCRWQRILGLAAEQSRREAVPGICAPSSLEEAVHATRAAHLRCVLAPDGPQRLAALPPSPQGATVVLFVGPEGGFDETETRFLMGHEVEAASLGPYILRTEIAALAAVAILLSRADHR